MALHNLKKTPDYKVREWLEKSIPELTPYQKERIRNDEIIRWAPFDFYERRKPVKSIWWRLSIIAVAFFWVVLFVGLPLNFIVTGNWGYNKLNWFDTWLNKIGF